MHIKHIHELIEKLSECACSKLSSGIENVNTCEMGQVIDMIKDLADAEYHARISKAMEEAEEDEKEEEKYLLKMFKDQYGEEDARRYYDEYRYKSGRFAPKGHGMRRGYNEPPYWHMTPEMYRDWDTDRDMDRDKHGRMYYTEPKSSSRYDMARRGYTDARDTHKDKDTKMHELESYMTELGKDVTDLISDMTPEERTLAKSKLATLINKM